MYRETWLRKSAWGLSFVLGQASSLLGLTFALVWLFAFVVLVPPKLSGWASGPRGTLPVEPPVIGLALGALGLLLARASRGPVARYSVAGLLFNAVPLALALLVLALRAL